jgi:RNA polymerase sigma factor for flagellar operon FliA
VLDVTPARRRYLHVLGFEPGRADRNEPDLGEQVPPVRRQTARQANADNPATVAHFKWFSTDGEWERSRRISGSDPAAPPPTDPLTLAGHVAIDNETDLDRTWTRFKESENQSDRDQLIIYYSPLVKYVASRVAAGLPQSVDQSDLVSYGMFGLIDAITKFDPGRGYKFETYAISRVKGAILDELRSIDWVPRSVRSKAKSVERAMLKLESKLHRAPTDAEIAEELDVSLDQLNSMYNQISSLGIVALDEMLSFNGSESLTFGDTLADRSDGPGGVYERVEMRQLLADAINRMTEREKIVLTLYYYENMTLAEIGGVLGVTESRVCQIHTKAVLQLKSRLSSMERESA